VLRARAEAELACEYRRMGNEDDDEDDYDSLGCAVMCRIMLDAVAWDRRGKAPRQPLSGVQSKTCSAGLERGRHILRGLWPAWRKLFTICHHCSPSSALFVIKHIVALQAGWKLTRTLLVRCAVVVPTGRLPVGTGQWPVLPIGMRHCWVRRPNSPKLA